MGWGGGGRGVVRLGAGIQDGAWRTGLADLDAVLGGGLQAGECLLWDAEFGAALADVARVFAAAAREDGRPVTYFRFAAHEPLLDGASARVVRLDAGAGFEAVL